jgi:predicted DNA-binding ArsR family transcriptional regulator
VHIGQEIKKLVDEKNIKVGELMSALNLNRQSIYDIYKREDIKTNQLKVIAGIFNLPVNYFFEDESSTKKMYKIEESRNLANESKEEYDTVISSYKVTVEALQSEIETLKELIALKNEKIREQKDEIERLKGRAEKF